MNTTTEMVELCASDEVADGEIRRGTLPSGHAVAIYHVNGAFYVTDDICSHGEASLSEDGSLDGYEVECSWHFGRFDVRSGAPCAMPCEHAIRSWPVKIDGGRVFVDAGAHAL
ncbi:MULTISPECIES: non-heme iron oxygenase ferredoxin subunit [Burkholderia]|uniref:Ferredoxin n=1 Tax=Burkholderia aenigmatica TaxID=2015348 RepID=A0A228HUJ9_9BURK|nr:MULTISPECIES: non-heme iron oxygenase ferredoxin subunit [Burkholderia]KER69025.1 ferredoxin [Burkholderia cepacia]MBN3838419.1 non-heme iron oxygenase ferredoxin subunit [Burkholderia sp. Ac-20349]MDN7875093.1 non-heme iron oxygenase ferredoxin subunit [Burkholderia aenigmatica]OXI33582.1 ferredoxin [Burkholderia aenigmatica]